MMSSAKFNQRPPLRTRPRGRPLDATALDFIVEHIGEEGRAADRLIENLHCIQDRLHCLPAPYRRALAEWMNLPMAQIEEVARFYAHFDCVESLADQPAPLTVRVCESLPCMMAGAAALRAALENDPSTKVRVVSAPCIGSCAEAPSALVGTIRVGHANRAAIDAAIENQTMPHPLPPYRTLVDYRSAGGYTLLNQLVSGTRTIDDVIETLAISGLQGLGGAGFPVARKWLSVQAQPAPRLMTINADEGEPGTFKDRFWLEHDPHVMLEGALIAAHCVGIDKIYLYLRDEYPTVRIILTNEIAALEEAGLIPAGFIALRRGAGAYICGEESAMIESIEGKRGYPRQRPPLIAEQGLFGRPTLNHNVESLCWIRIILERGGTWFASRGLNGAKGLRSWSVSGRVKHPGVYIAPAGITAQQLIALDGGLCDGHRFKAFLPGGASGGILPASLADRPLDFGSLKDVGAFVGSHAVVILSDHDSIRAAVQNLIAFFEDESCGQCTPCRVGTEKMAILLAQPQWDIELLTELSAVMADASICGLGQAAPNPLLTALRFFADELRA